MAHLQEAVLGGLLLLAAYYDIRTGKIPNRLIVTGWAAGMILCLCQSGIDRTLWRAEAAVIVIVSGFLLFHMGMIGAGDVKLFSVVSCMQDRTRMLQILVTFFVIAGGMSLWKMAGNRLFLQRFCYFWRYITGQTGRAVYYEQKQDGTECSILLAPAMAGAYFLVLAAEQMGVI